MFLPHFAFEYSTACANAKHHVVNHLACVILVVVLDFMMLCRKFGHPHKRSI
jgi:hypothetical protein